MFDRVVRVQAARLQQVAPVVQPAEEELESVGDVVVDADGFVVALVAN